MSFRVAVAVAALAFALAGCSSGSDLQPGYQEHLDSIDDYEQSEEYLQSQGDNYYEQQRADDFAARGWRCYWNPTFNDDWHDDNLCSSGAVTTALTFFLAIRSLRGGRSTPPQPNTRTA